MLHLLFHFGYGEFFVRQFYPDELNLDIPDHTGLSRIEARQKYFHWWYVPVFPTKKIWIVKNNEYEYPLTKLQVNHIYKQGIEVSTPWYTWSGAIVYPAIIASWIIFLFQ